jgi:hypothetical protein
MVGAPVAIRNNACRCRRSLEEEPLIGSVFDSVGYQHFPYVFLEIED